MQEFDVVDALEKNKSLVQWNQHDEAEPDDALKNMPGSVSNPQLARMMCLSFYNERFRWYKRRNLQAAVRAIIAFEEKHPWMRGSISINFDPDNKINP